MTPNATDYSPQEVQSRSFDPERNTVAISTASKTVEVSPTLDTNAYASGDRLGSVMTLTDFAREIGEHSTACFISIVDKAKQSQSIDIMFFDESPTIASADNAPIDITDAEMADKWLCTVSVLDTQYKALAGNSTVQAEVSIPMKAIAASKNLYALCVCRSGTPTYAASSLAFRFVGIQD